MKKLTSIILPLLYFGHTATVQAKTTLDDSTKEIIKGIINPTPNILGSNIWDLDSPNVVNQSENFQWMGTAISTGDYNNDGYEDMAVGIPGFDYFTLNAAGTVVILYGSANGLTGTNSQMLFQTFTTSPPNTENNNGVEANDEFGSVLASGDFNCDGFVDLAVGTPKEDVTFTGDGGVSRDDVGAVNIFYGSASGFATDGQGSTFLLQGTNSGFTMAEAGDQFGFSMAVGNFNYDFNNGKQCMDLAIGAPYEDFGNNNSTTDAGIVTVLFGSASGIDGSDRESISENSAGVGGSSQSNDLFGYSLAAGNLGKTVVGIDLAVGVPGQVIGGLTDAGTVHVFYSDGSNGFMTSVDDQIWSQNSGGGTPVVGVAEADDKFGYSVVIGNFDGSSYSDLAIGVYGEDLNTDGITDAGAVNVLYSTVSGLSSTNNQLFYQLNAGLQGDPQNFDHFSETLSAGDLNYDGIPDLVVGVPSKNVSAGAFHVIYGAANGLTTQNNDYFVNTVGGDVLSTSLAIGDFGKGPQLAAGLTGYNSSDNNISSGGVQVFEFVNPDVIFKDGFEN